jgi:hypothetical protein
MMMRPVHSRKRWWFDLYVDLERLISARDDPKHFDAVTAWWRSLEPHAEEESDEVIYLVTQALKARLLTSAAIPVLKKMSPWCERRLQELKEKDRKGRD